MTNPRRDTARRWVIDERRSDEDVVHLIVRGYHEGPARLEMESYVNEARAELGWWTDLEAAYRKSGYMPGIDLVSSALGIAEKTLRRQCREHGIANWAELHARFGRSAGNAHNACNSRRGNRL